MGEDRVSDFIKEEDLRKHFVKVFDERTILAVHKLAKRGFIDHLEYLVSEGKEASVFRAVDKNGNFVAVKIYKIETSNFRKMQDYLTGDPRFGGISNDKRSVVFAWTKKEYKNLEIATKAKLDVPLPIASFENCLVMEYIGENGDAAKKMKDNRPENVEKAYETLVNFIAVLYKANLVHSDLSEYNILNDKGRVVVIDIGQAVSRNHPKAKEFFERDLENVAKYFRRLGMKKSYEEIYADVKGKLGGK